MFQLQGAFCLCFLGKKFVQCVNVSLALAFSSFLDAVG